MNVLPDTEAPKPRLTVKIATIVTIFLLVLVLATTSLLVFWNVQNPDVLTAKNIPFPVRPGSNVPGQIEFVHINYCKTFKAKGEVVARLVGKKSIIRIPWPADIQPPQCLDIEVPIVVPTYAIDDVYYFDFTITYRVNPLKEKTVYLRSQTFNVAKVLP